MVMVVTILKRSYALRRFPLWRYTPPSEVAEAADSSCLFSPQDCHGWQSCLVGGGGVEVGGEQAVTHVEI